MTTAIRYDDLVESVAAALQYISYYHPTDYISHLARAYQREESAAAPGATLQAGGIRLDAEAHRVEIKGREVVLTATEFKLLERLLERRGRVQTRARLLADVWGYAEDVDSRTVDTHVRRLRRKLGGEADRLETVIGVGYRLRA